MDDKKTLLDRVAAMGENRVLLARILDKCTQCETRNVPTHTDFLSPAQQCTAEDLLRAAHTAQRYVFFGGYAEAERKMLFFLPDWADAPDADGAMAFLRGAFHESESPSHRDFLGSLTGFGIMREKIGDILVSACSADVIVSAELAPHLLREWNSAGRTPLRVSAITAEELIVPEKTCKIVRDTVAALRLDAVIAAALGMSRAKACDLIRAGRVQKDYRECTKADAPVRQGDVISVRGVGKFELSEVGGLSKKGRTALLIRRYL